jgi:hypothetical protein
LRRFKKSTEQIAQRTKAPNRQKEYPEKRDFNQKKTAFLVVKSSQDITLPNDKIRELAIQHRKLGKNPFTIVFGWF